MSRTIVVGTRPEGALPEDRLTDEEHQEVTALLQALERHGELARVARDRLELLLLVARDRRGLTGRFEVDTETGRIAPASSRQEVRHG